MNRLVETLRKLLIFFSLLTLVHCTKTDQQTTAFGLVLTVDDGYVDQWYEHLEFLEEFDARLTFYITNYPTLSQEQISKLHRIEAAGNEIAFHGTNHVSVNTYLENHTVSQYMNLEIAEGLDAMRRDTFTIDHFAYPYGASNEEIDDLLLGKFTSIRKICSTNETTKLKDLDKAHYTLPCTSRIIKGAGIDNVFSVPLEDITEALDELMVTKETLLLYCHKLSDEPGDYHISVEKMKGIVTYCYYHHIPMLTVNDMYYVNSI